MINVIDEVIEGQPKYNIIDNGDGTYTIELANSVIQEGTKINKSLFNSIMENNTVMTDLDDFEMDTGTVYNAGAGWNTITFDQEFSGVPNVTAIVEGETYKVQVKNITTRGFAYRLVNDTITTSVTVTPTTATTYTSTRTSWTSTSTTYVSSVSGSASSTRNESSVSSTSLKINYIAVYNGGKG